MPERILTNPLAPPVIRPPAFKNHKMEAFLKDHPEAQIILHSENSLMTQRIYREAREDANAIVTSGEYINDRLHYQVDAEVDIADDGDYAYVHCALKVKIGPRCSLCYCIMGKKHDEGCAQAD